MAADRRVFMVEMYTPGEIVEPRRPFGAQTPTEALQAARPWVNDSEHNATNFRVVDRDGTTLFDKLVTDFN